MGLVRNYTVLLEEVEKFLELSLKSDSANRSELLGGQTKDVFKNKEFNHSSASGDAFENIHDTLWDANQLLEEMGYKQSYDVKFW